MQHIHCKDIFILLRETLELYDKHLMEHGSKVAYCVYKMLQYKGGYMDYELADIAFVATFHDIGAYKTNNVRDFVRFETKEMKPHSLYGYLFVKGLTAVGEMAKIILYHHTDYITIEKMDLEYKDAISYMHFAGMFDVFNESLGEKFDLDIFKKQIGTKFSKDAYETFIKANEEYDLFGKIKSNAYKDELDELLDNFILPNEEKVKLLRFIMFVLALKSDTAIFDAITSLAICEKLGIEMRLTRDQLECLRYAGYLHDIGMMAYPKSWLENQGKITLQEAEKIKQHTLLTERLLQNKIKKEVIIIAATHHEHADGSGYPRRITDKQMSVSQLILQFADAVSVLITPGPGRQTFEKERIIDMIKTQTDAGIFNQTVARKFVEGYDDIIEYVENKSKAMLVDYQKIKTKYENAMTEKK